MPTEVANTALYPYSAVVWLVSTFADGTKLRSAGTIVGRNDILTLTTSIYLPEHGGYATSLAIYPGADTTSNGSAFTAPTRIPFPVGSVRFELLGFPSQVFADSNNDALSATEWGSNLAMIGLDVPIGDTTGAFGIDPGYNTTTTARVIAYPPSAPGQMEGVVTVTNDALNSIYLADSANGGVVWSSSIGGPLYVTTDKGPVLIGVQAGDTPTLSWFVDVSRTYSALLAARTANDSLLAAQPSLSIAALQADRAEGSATGSVFYTFTVDRSGDIGAVASVRYQVGAQALPGYVAVNESDFIGNAYPSGLLSFAAGEKTKTVRIEIASDRVIESNESFSVTLQSPTGGILGTATAYGIIRNDDLALGEASNQDIPASTGSTVSVPLNGAVAATISSASDHDWFRVDARKGEVYLFEAAGADDGAGTLADATLSLRNATGTELLFNDDLGLGRSSRIAHLASADGPLFLDVGGDLGSTGTYQIRVSNAVNADLDPPGDSSTGRLLVPQEMQVGRRESASDTDWYRVDLLAGNIYEFAVVPLGLSDPVLRLRDSSGKLIATNDDAKGVTYSLIQYVPTTNGSVYLDVGAYNASDTGAYSVWAQSVPALTTEQFSFTTANVAQLEGSEGSRGLSLTIFRTGATQAPATLRIDVDHVTTDGSDIDLSNAVLEGDQAYYLVNFGAVITSASLNLMIRGDTRREDDERLDLRILAANGQTTGAIDTAAITISNDDLASTAVEPVYRFAKLSNGAYFFTGSRPERDQIISSFPDFRPEGIAFQAYADSAAGEPVYRFANLSNGGYFYTGSAAERDATIRDYPNMRYEGSTFSVASPQLSNALPVFRLANLNNGAYLYTTGTAERDAAQSLGFWRYEGISFYAPPGDQPGPAADDYAGASSTAGRIQAGQSQSGVIERAGDSDWFAIDLLAGQRYTFDLRTLPTPGALALADPFLSLWSANSQLLLTDDDSGGNKAARIDFTPALSATYYLAAQGTNDAGGAYSLSASLGVGNAATDDFPASSSTAGRAEPGRTANGRIETSADVDWLGVPLEAGRQYSFSLSAVSGSALRPAFEILDPRGSVLVSESNAAGAASISLGVAAPSAGTYFVAIRSANSATTGGYALTTSAGSVSTSVTGTIGFIGEEKPVVIEGSATSPGILNVTVQRSGSTSAAATATVQLNLIASGASANDIDLIASGFPNSAALLSFAPGQVSQTLRLVMRGDAIIEQPALEAFNLVISAATGATVGSRSTLQIQIQDDDKDDSGAYSAPDLGAESAVSLAMANEQPATEQTGLGALAGSLWA